MRVILNIYLRLSCDYNQPFFITRLAKTGEFGKIRAVNIFAIAIAGALFVVGLFVGHMAHLPSTIQPPTTTVTVSENVSNTNPPAETSSQSATITTVPTATTTIVASQTPIEKPATKSASIKIQTNINVQE